MAKAYLKSTSPNIITGKFNYYYPDSTIMSSMDKIYFGSYCALGQNVRIIGDNHDTSLPALQINFYKTMFGTGSYPGKISKGPISIGSDVWIGDNVIILSGVTIGDGAVIGAGSVVTKNIPAYTLAAGVPAKSIRKRFTDEVIEFLLQIKWWTWNEDRIKLNKQFFMTNLNKTDLETIKGMIR